MDRGEGGDDPAAVAGARSLAAEIDFAENGGETNTGSGVSATLRYGKRTRRLSAVCV
jgi:hypothetical protein